MTAKREQLYSELEALSEEQIEVGLKASAERRLRELAPSFVSYPAQRCGRRSNSFKERIFSSRVRLIDALPSLVHWLLLLPYYNSVGISASEG